MEVKDAKNVILANAMYACDKTFGRFSPCSLMVEAAFDAILLELGKVYKWIDVEDHLPEVNGDYLCTLKRVSYYSADSINDGVIEHDVRYLVKIVNYQDGWPIDYHVIAWMQLPEAYRKE